MCTIVPKNLAWEDVNLQCLYKYDQNLIYFLPLKAGLACVDL